MKTKIMEINSLTSLRDKTSILIETNICRIYLKNKNDRYSFETSDGQEIQDLSELAQAIKNYQTDLVWEIEPYQNLLTILKPHIDDLEDKSNDVFYWLLGGFALLFFLTRFIFNI